jgi:hypothetical protein
MLGAGRGEGEGERCSYQLRLVRIEKVLQKVTVQLQTFMNRIRYYGRRETRRGEKLVTNRGGQKQQIQ